MHREQYFHQAAFRLGIRLFVMGFLGMVVSGLLAFAGVAERWRAIVVIASFAICVVATAIGTYGAIRGILRNTRRSSKDPD